MKSSRAIQCIGHIGIVRDNYTPTKSSARARDMLGFNWHCKLRTCEFLFAVSSTIYGMVWKRTHNVHHVITNAPKHDPDNQHLLFLAMNNRFVRSTEVMLLRGSPDRL